MRTNELTREQRIIDAGMRFDTLLAGDEVPNVRAFVQTCDADIRDELQAHLEYYLVTEHPEEPIILTAEEQALADRVGERTTRKFMGRLGRN